MGKAQAISEPGPFCLIDGGYYGPSIFYAMGHFYSLSNFWPCLYIFPQTCSSPGRGKGQNIKMHVYTQYCVYTTKLEGYTQCVYEQVGRNSAPKFK